MAVKKKEQNLKDVKNFIFDLDSTVWHWNRLIPGVKQTIRRLEAKGKDIYYVTNNSILTRKEFAEKLSDLGLKTKEDNVICSSYVAAQVFADKNIDSVYAIGEKGLLDELGREHITKSDDADHVIVGVDRNFSYWKMAKAAEAIRYGAKLWTTAYGENFRAGDRILPGTGALLESVKKSADVEDAEIIGKPSDHMVKIIRDEFPILTNRTVLIGDHLQTDIVTGNKLGIKTGLVLGGTSKKEDLSGIESIERPNFVFKDFKRILRKV